MSGGSGSNFAVALGDLDGDGILDMALPNYTGIVEVYLGKGDGSFGPRTTFGTPSNVLNIVLGDLDGDGRLDAVVANRVLPPEARSPYFDKWFGIQAGHLAEARKNFDPLPFFEARLFDREMVGLPLLAEFARDVFGDEDPTRVFFREKPIEVKKEKGGYALYIRLPFAEKDKIEVWAQGDELVVQVDNQRRHVVLPRTLASRKLLGAAFAEQRLRVAFGDKEDHAARREGR